MENIELFVFVLQWMLLRTSLPDGIYVKVFEDRMVR